MIIELQDYSIKDIIEELQDYKTAPYIYALLEPDGNLENKNSIRYVGKTKNPKQRLQDHISSSRRKNTPKSTWILDLRHQGKRPKMVILWRCHRNYILDVETAWINLFLKLGCPLLNTSTPLDIASTTIETFYKTNGEEPPEDCVEIFKQFIQFVGICEREGVSINTMAYRELEAPND